MKPRIMLPLKRNIIALNALLRFNVLLPSTIAPKPCIEYFARKPPSKQSHYPKIYHSPSTSCKIA